MQVQQKKTEKLNYITFGTQTKNSLLKWKMILRNQIAGTLISTKRNLEKINVLPTKVFEGFGNESNDPTFKLKQLINEKYKDEIKKENRIIRRNKHQIVGGAIPLIPIAVAGLATIASKVVSDL